MRGCGNYHLMWCKCRRDEEILEFVRLSFCAVGERERERERGRSQTVRRE